MTKEQLAATIDGREYGKQMIVTSTEEAVAKENRLLVIFGASDDLCELRGAIHDEVGAWNGCEIRIKDGGLLQDIESDERDVLEKHGVLAVVQDAHDLAVRIEVAWRNDEYPTWLCETEAPHATFTIMEDGTEFCRGLVLDLKELGQVG